MVSLPYPVIGFARPEIIFIQNSCRLGSCDTVGMINIVKIHSWVYSSPNNSRILSAFELILRNCVWSDCRIWPTQPVGIPYPGTDPGRFTRPEMNRTRPGCVLVSIWPSNSSWARGYREIKFRGCEVSNINESSEHSGWSSDCCSCLQLYTIRFVYRDRFKSRLSASSSGKRVTCVQFYTVRFVYRNRFKSLLSASLSAKRVTCVQFNTVRFVYRNRFQLRLSASLSGKRVTWGQFYTVPFVYRNLLKSRLSASLRGKRMTCVQFNPVRFVYRNWFKSRLSASLSGKHVTCIQFVTVRFVFRNRFKSRLSQSLGGKHVTCIQLHHPICLPQPI